MVKVIATSTIELAREEYYDAAVDGIVWADDEPIGPLLGHFGKAKLRYVNDNDPLPLPALALRTGKLLQGGKHHS